MAFKGITAFILGNNGEGGGGGGGTSNYNELSNKPQINGNELVGNKSSGDLGIKIGNVPIDGNAYLSDLEKSYNQITPTYTSQTFHGVTFVVNKDKSITANGTADSDITLTVAHFVPSESNLKLSGTPADGSSSKYYLYVVDNATSEHTVDEYSADPVDIPVSANDCSIKLRIKSGVTCTNVVFKPMVRYSTDPATYIPSYTSNDELESMISNKVDKIAGKVLSSNDYTDGEKEDVAKVDGLVSSVGSLTSRVGIAEGKVRTLEGEMLSVQDALDTKVDKETGKGLSTNDYTNADKAIVDGVTTALAGKVDTSSVGTANGVAGLDNTGRVPSSQLPSYVDDVLEFASLSEFPVTGEGSKIYIALDTNKTYRWSGSDYVEISESLALGETQGTAYEGNKGKANADAIDALESTVESLGTASTKNSTSVVTQSTDLVESGAVKDIVGWGNKNGFDLSNISTGESYFTSSQKGKVINIANPTAGTYKNTAFLVSVKPNTDMHIVSNVSVSSGVARISVSTADNVTEIASSGAITSETVDLSFNTGNNTVLLIKVYCTTSTSELGNVTYTDMMLLSESETDLTYEPYHASVSDSLDTKMSYADNGVLGAKNKLPNMGISETINNVTFTKNSDGTVTANGTASADITYYILPSGTVNDFNFKDGDILSGCPANGGDNTYRLTALFSGNSNKWIEDTGNGKILDTTENKPNVSVYIVIKNGVTVSNLVFKPMIRLATDTDPTYQPYAQTNRELTVNKADNSVIAPVENGTNASQPWSVGQHFMNGEVLKEVTNAIAVNEQINSGNSKDVNVSDIFDDLYSNIGILTTPVSSMVANSLPVLKRNITNAFYNGSLRSEIAAGNFKNVRVGDYIIGQATGSTYYVASCDYWFGLGDNTNNINYPSYGTHHLGLMLFKPVGTTALWKGYGYSDKSWRVSASDLGRCPWNADTTADPTDTEAIGTNSTNITRSYNGTNVSAYMGSFIRERIDAILLPQCFQADFGSSNVLKRRNWLSNAINTSAASGARSDWAGIASGAMWTDRFIDLPSEVELYGTRINSSSRDDVGVQCEQLPLFRNARIHDFYPRMDLWTKAIVGSSGAAGRGNAGLANANSASNAFWAAPLGCVK